MNFFLKESIEYAQQRTYLDDLYSVYPTINNNIRDIDKELWGKKEEAFDYEDNAELLRKLFNLNLSPLTNIQITSTGENQISAYNKKTISRLANEVRSIVYNEFERKCIKQKNARKKTKSMFRNWVTRTEWGIPRLNNNEFSATDNDAICISTKKEMTDFSKNNLNYSDRREIDFLARINGKYVIGISSLIMGQSKNQISQFHDIIKTAKSNSKAVTVAILDGVLYEKEDNRMYKEITNTYSEYNIMSSLLLRDFLYTL